VQHRTKHRLALIVRLKHGSLLQGRHSNSAREPSTTSLSLLGILVSDFVHVSLRYVPRTLQQTSSTKLRLLSEAQHQLLETAG
jgi:hypothetical protein